MKSEHQFRENITNYIHWICLAGMVILSLFFLGLVYKLQVAAGQASQAIFQSILIYSIIAIGIIAIAMSTLKHYLTKVINIIKDKEYAEQQAEIKAKFLSTMSHEIRTPMNAVIGLSNILLQENPRTDQIDNLKTLKFSGDLLLALINDILDYSKLEAGKISFEAVNFNLFSLVKNIKKSLEIKATEKNIDLDIKIGSNVPHAVIGDPVRLSQILTNLIGNAIKFTQEGKVTISIDSLGEVGKKSNIRISVKDTGIGIKEENFDKIFQSFSQADTDTTRKFGGTGLGLSITKKLLELQGSQIQLESELGVGSNFFFDLPFEIGNIQDIETSNEQATEIGNADGFDGVDILLVEDNKINIMVAQKFLKKWNLNVDIAENGQIALDKVQQNEYKLILMDLEMPVMDGYQATQNIRALKQDKYNQIPIVALSASAVADFRDRAIKTGMNEFVTKPFNPPELYRVLSHFLKASA